MREYSSTSDWEFYFGTLAVRRKIYTNRNEFKEVLRKKDSRRLLYHKI